jgi:hypothetical protein
VIGVERPPKQDTLHGRHNQQTATEDNKGQLRYQLSLVGDARLLGTCWWFAPGRFCHLVRPFAWERGMIRLCVAGRRDVLGEIRRLYFVA